VPLQTTPDRPSAAAQRARAASPVVAYDFRRPTKLSRDNVRGLQVAYDTFARRLATLLTSGLREVCQVTVGEIGQQSYDDFVSSLETPSLSTPMTAAPLAGTGILSFSLPVALAAVDHMLGGPGGRQPARPLTDIESGLVRGLLDQIAGVLRYALEPIAAVEPAMGPVEYNPQFLQVAGPSDAMIVGEFTLAIGDQSCRLAIALPLASLLPLLVTERPHEAAVDSGPTAALLRRRLADVPLEVNVEFEPVTLSPARILALAVGDVVPLPHTVGAPLTVRAGATDYARAVAGKSGTRLAALVVEGPGTTPKESA
jgi:flagellar motor switch protein FliM